MDEYFNLLKTYNLWGGNTPQMGFFRRGYTDRFQFKYVVWRVGYSIIGAICQF